ncbi:MAG: hypothetical protein K5910_03905 [Bacteroidales bacterium]|nr:hypothetical protein [Bacteroidales bacterium]
MKLYKWLVPVLLVLAFTTMPGCKKSSDPEYNYLSGTLSLSMPVYVLPGFTKSFNLDTLTTLSRSDGGTIGYRFVNPDTGEADTLVTADGVVKHKEFTVTVPDKIASQTLTVSAFVPSDAYYYGTSATRTYTIVRPGVGDDSSITNFTKTETTLEDGRDGRSYYTAEAGGLEWMRQNLAWTGAGRPFALCDAMTDVFGRFYTWEEAQNACPEGWRLPTDADWTALGESAESGKDLRGLAGKVMGDLYFNETKMWEYWREVKISDELKLSAMPVGYAMVSSDDWSFDGLYTYAAFWTSDESDGMGVCRYIYHDKDIVYRGRMSKTDFAASVRCVRE